MQELADEAFRDLLKKHGRPASLREALADAQTAHNEMVLQGHDGEQLMRVIGSPIRMSNAPAGMRRPPPRLGEHTEEVLAEARAMAAANLD